jgi:hypothetical protein
VSEESLWEAGGAEGRLEAEVQRRRKSDQAKLTLGPEAAARNHAAGEMDRGPFAPGDLEERQCAPENLVADS